MGNTFRGKSVADGIRVAIVAGSFNELIVTQLLDGAEDTLEKNSIGDSEADIYWVPGVFEIPQTVSWLLDEGGYDGVLALGCLIKGETDHYDLLAQEVTRGLGSLSTVAEIPIAFGVLTCENLEQALHRAGSKSGNKGSDAMLALIEMINLSSAIGVEDIPPEDSEESNQD